MVYNAMDFQVKDTERSAACFTARAASVLVSYIKQKYGGRKITASFGNVTARGERKMERSTGKHDDEESV
jgi:hypothetical protein